MAQTPASISILNTEHDYVAVDSQSKATASGNPTCRDDHLVRCLIGTADRNLLRAIRCCTCFAERITDAELDSDQGNVSSLELRTLYCVNKQVHQAENQPGKFKLLGYTTTAIVTADQVASFFSRCFV